MPSSEAQLVRDTGRTLTDTALRRLLELYPGDQDVLAEPTAVGPPSALRIEWVYRGRDVILAPIESPAKFSLFALDARHAIRSVAEHGGTLADLEYAVMSEATKWGLSAVLRDLPGGPIEFDIA